MKIPFGPPFPGIDAISLRDGIASGLVNGYINELGDYHMAVGHTLFATHSGAMAIDSLYETLNGTVLTVTNGNVVRVNSNGTFTAFTGDTITADTYCYWAEDQQHVYIAHGGKLARVDLTNLIVTLMNENTPTAVTHVCRSKGYLLTNGNDVVIASSVFTLSQVFDTSISLDAVVVMSDQSGWILATGRSTVSPNNVGRIYLSKDNGVNWTKVHSVSANEYVLALEYMGSGVVLAGTGTTTGRILRSTDYGVTWSDLGQQGSSTKINFIRKLTSTIAIAGTGSGTSLGKIYRSTNTGTTWAALATDFGKQCTEGEPVTASGATVVIGTISNADAIVIYRSTDTGASFSSIQTLTGSGYIPAIQRISDTISVMSNGVTSTSTQKVWRSTDAGLTWALQAPIPDFSDDALAYAFCLLADGSLLMATAGNNVGTGGAQIWKSTDDGVTWSLVAELNTSKEAVVQQRGLKETHVTGTVIATGRVALEAAGKDTAAKWQTALGRNAPQGDVFYSADFANSYQNVDSWERFNAEAVPDACTGVFENRGLVYAAGPRSIEINYSSPDAEFPWQVSDPSLPYGLGAPNSWVNYDDMNTVMYLSCTDKVWEIVKFQGRVQQTISQVYASVLNDRTLVTTPATAKAWGVVMRGIPMYVITFPSDALTICYNLVKDHWWRWAYWNGSSYESAIINAYTYSKTLKKHLVGDRRDNGKIYELTGTADDTGDIRFELTSGHVAAGTWSPKPVGRMLFKCKRGAVTDGSEPTFSWQARDNGNQNFSTARTVSLGLANDNEMFGSLNRCGMYQTRQHRIVYLGTKTDFIFAGADES